MERGEGEISGDLSADAHLDIESKYTSARLRHLGKISVITCVGSEGGYVRGSGKHITDSRGDAWLRGEQETRAEGR